MPKTVRLAEPPDEAQLFSLLIDMHRYNGGGWGIPYNLALVRDHVEAGTRRIMRTDAQGIQRPDTRFRSNPNNEAVASIGVIGPLGGHLEASIGLFVEPVAWFSDVPGFSEKWLFVRPEARDRRHLEDDLFHFARWARSFMDAGAQPFPFRLLTGFVYDGADPRRRAAMDRLWTRKSGGRRIGSLFMTDR
jgi:hypothetical protein